MNNVLILVLLSVLSYFFGNINWAIIISKFKKTDIRKMGSGNPGTLNMSRNLGLGFGLLTFFLDIMKGVIPTLIAYFVFRNEFFENTTFRISDFAIYLCGLCVVIGHIYPVIFKFKGGKGIASTIGVFIVCESVHGWEWSIVMIMALVAAGLFIYFTEFGAMGSFIAITPPAISSFISLFITYAEQPTCLTFHIVTNMLILAICLFTWFAHRHNIERMLAGDEHPTSIKEMVVKLKLKQAKKRKLIEAQKRLNQQQNLSENISSDDESTKLFSGETDKSNNDAVVKHNVSGEQNSTTDYVEKL